MSLREKRELVVERLKSFPEAVVAFSGGVDSALLLKLRLLSAKKTRAVIGISPAVPFQDRFQAIQLCKSWKVPLLQVATQEWKKAAYRRNDGDRCFHCKDTLFSLLKELAELGISGTVLYGANSDDLQDYRPGLRAASLHKVVAPLAEAALTKEEVRALARELAVPIWDKPSSPCLASRLPYGEEVTPQKLSSVELAESFLRALGFSKLRVRYYPNQRAKIELSEEDIPKLFQKGVRRKIVVGLKKCGFKEVLLDLEPHRSGKLNVDLGYS